MRYLGNGSILSTVITNPYWLYDNVEFGDRVPKVYAKIFLFYVS